MAKVKIGPAFFDNVSGEGRHRSRSSASPFNSEILSLAPAFFLILLFGIVFLRLAYVQVVRGEYYTNLSDQNRTRTESIPAPRGIINDRFGRALVANSPSFKIVNGKKTRILT